MAPQLLIKLVASIRKQKPRALDQFKLYPEYNVSWAQERRKLKK